MPTDPQNEKPAENEAQNDWLLQFYTPSKTTILTEFSDTPEGGQESPAAQLSTLPGEKYAVGDELGTGAMKVVRRTLDKNAARDVALAVMLDPAARPKKVNRFVREARITAALEHPNIVPIYDIGVDEAGKPYFTMKLLGGETLHSILQKLNEGNGDYKKRYPLNWLLRIFLSVCNAVNFAHSRGVIHLDLKPANIQVGDFGEVLVLDWGLAKVLQKDPAQFPHRLELGEGLREIPKEGVVRGTPGFMGPEQARGEYASLNEQTDIFALGAVLYTILQCKPPSKNSATGSKSKPRSESSSGFKIPTALEAVAAKAMARQPVNRYQTVAELAGDVQAFLDGYATKAQQAGALTLLWLLVKRHYVVTTLLCLSLTLAFGILSVSLAVYHHSEQKAKAALKIIEDDEERTRNLSLMAAPKMLQMSEYSIHITDYDHAISELEYMVAFDNRSQPGEAQANDFHTAWWELGALYLGRLQFEEAEAAFSHVAKMPDANAKQPQGLNDLPQIARKYSAAVRADGGMMPRDLEGPFVSEVLHAERAAWQFRLITLGAFFKNQNRSTDTMNFEVIEQALREMNPDAKDLEFTHQTTEDGFKVSLHGDKVSQILPLTGLPIAYLDLSNTGAVDLGWVRDAPLVVVDLSNSRTSDLQPLSKIPTLTELRLVNTHERDYGLLRSMSQVKRIVVSKEDLADTKKAMAWHSRTPPEVIGE